MSQPIKRYINGRFGLDPHESGEWVKWEDYAALAAEVERLREAGDLLERALILRTYKEDLHPSIVGWDAAKEGGAK